MRRLGLEALERRACPAVMFDFIQGDDGGILRITGDEGPNVIEIFQPRDGVVEVVGDGERRSFEGVNLVSVETGDGDDDVAAEWVFGTELPRFKLDVDVGDGNDRVTVNDGGDREPTRRRNSVTTLSMDLGRGADELNVEANYLAGLNLNVNSSDGNDVMRISDPLAQSTAGRGSTWLLNFELGGGGNLMDVNTSGIGMVSLDVVAAGGGNTVEINQGWGPWEISPGRIADQTPISRADIMLAGDGNKVGFETRGYEQVNLDLGLTGDGNEVNIVDSYNVFTEDPGRHSSAQIDLAVGRNSLVNVRLENIENVDLSLVSDPASPEPVTGGTINVYWHYINNGSSRLGRNDPVVILKSTLPGGSAVPVYGQQVTFTATVSTVSPAATSVNAALHLGPEDDTVSFLSRNVDELQLDFSTGDGEDTVVVNAQSNVPQRWFSEGPSPINQPPVLGLVVDLGGGNDVAGIHSEGYDDSLNLTAGPGDDEVSTDSFYGTGVYKTIDSGKTWSVDLGDGNDRLVAASQGFSEDNTVVKAGDGNDTVVVNARIKPLFAFLVEGLDHTQLNLAADLGGGDDLLEVYTAGYAGVNSLIDGGDGDDEIHLRHKMFAIVDRTQLNVVVLLGLGSDTLVLETLNYRDFETTIDTGPAGDGIDTVTAYHMFKPSRGRVSRIPLTLDGGRDTLVFIAKGYDTHNVQPINDTLTHEVGHW